MEIVGDNFVGFLNLLMENNGDIMDVLMVKISVIVGDVIINFDGSVILGDLFGD